jgi:peptide-methionine (S)-S-oxide reductase
VRSRVGYAGGTKEGPTYRSMGNHTECIEFTFDPARISFEEILRIFWDAHDPTGEPYSCQYKAILFWHDAEQERLAVATRDRMASRLGRAVTTEVRPAGPFWQAEDYHQKYGLRRYPHLVEALLAADPSDTALVRSTAALRLNSFVARELDLAALKPLLEEAGFRARGETRLEGLERLAAAETGRR